MFRGILRTNLRTTTNISLGIVDFIFLFFRCAYDVAPKDFPNKKGSSRTLALVYTPQQLKIISMLSCPFMQKRMRFL